MTSYLRGTYTKIVTIIYLFADKCANAETDDNCKAWEKGGACKEKDIKNYYCKKTCNPECKN